MSKIKTTPNKIIIHSLLFILGLFVGFSAFRVITYLDSYNTTTESFEDTYYFQAKYLKYIERLALYINYRELGYISGFDTPNQLNNTTIVDENKNSNSEILISNDNLESFEFYNQKLNIDQCNFLYYVKNTTTGEVYVSPLLLERYDEESLDTYIDNIKSNKSYFILNTRTGKFLTNVNTEYNFINDSNLNWVIQTLENTYSPNEEQNHYIVYTSIAEGFPYTEDEFYSEYMNFTTLRSTYEKCIYLLPISLFLFIVFFVMAILDVGRIKGSSEIYLNSFDRWYTEPSALIIIIGLLLEFLFLDQFYDFLYVNFSITPMAFMVFTYIIMYPLAMYGFTSLIRRIKARTLFSNMIVYKLGYHIIHHRNMTLRVLAILVVFGFIQLFGFLLAASNDHLILFITLVLISDLFISIILIKVGIDYSVLISETKKIKEGDLAHKIPIQSLSTPANELGTYINSIGDGLSVAVEEKLKSERFKTELITNVSHDIKTPLTSIINYVDLIRKENVDNQRVPEYIQILQNKTWRLKTLIEDLVEVSKVTSGAISLNLERINLVELIKQAAGEFDDRFVENQLELVINTSHEAVYILADGRSTYRIIDNLFSNVNKYALKGTRVYLDISRGSSAARFIIKNVSATKLNITEDELMERFVRGDRSRNTEGSGLGLSIAESLATLQNGSFEIVLDGDLFKAIVTFSLYEDTPK